ncbi:unnamed protein product (macronuclear) [Paramecium tetraurelia]|uniref:Uncharacterized protein n=1 Tax=Paramecium tetraurelia TaxID=5888 RepID=A0BI36_PARTE|nr:uncharacterized protein GSPATT00029239001 [Paramecium tetraurelia]CAK58203.1 unnamed protein product [Paramecium tetraurelia]|eukprot:XP_001425601.1 hypothetical protein (macronuclear) [Paramecium tetraurelia strain d4-2]
MQASMPGGNGHLKPSLKLNQIVYLGAHNAPMSKCYGWIYAQQNVTLTEQYETYGARHFKIPLHWHVQDGIPQIVVAHEGDGGTNCKLSLVQRALSNPEKAVDRLKELFDLAIKYPNEVMIVKLESKLFCNTQTNGTQGWDRSLITKMLHSLLVELKGEERAITFQENNPPTLGWCRENKKNILITIEPREQVMEDLINYTYYSYRVSAQVDWETDPLEDVKTGKVQRGVTNKNDGSIWSPFLEIHLNPENSFKPDYQYRTKYNFYQHVKKRFLQYYHHCRKMPNFVVADFIDQGNGSIFVDEINQSINENDGFKPELF